MRKDLVNDIISNFVIILNILSESNCTVILLQCPIFSISEYNRKKGHPEFYNFQHWDVILKNQIARLNAGIRRVNELSNVTSPCFTILIYASKKVRRRYIYKYFYDLYSDGLHPEPLLARAWHIMILHRVVRDCQ